MATIRRFEDLECWQSGRLLKRKVYGLTRRCAFAHDGALVSQVRRALSSVTANIAEGFERGGNREFLQFLAISKGSCGEIRDHLYTALDEQYITEAEFHEAYDLAAQTGRLVGGFMRYLEHSALRGSKYVERCVTAPRRREATLNPEA